MILTAVIVVCVLLAAVSAFVLLPDEVIEHELPTIKRTSSVRLISTRPYDWERDGT